MLFDLFDKQERGHKGRLKETLNGEKDNKMDYHLELSWRAQPPDAFIMTKKNLNWHE